MLRAFPVISVVMASLNEAEGIGLTIKELQRFLGKFSLIVVDGNSDDQTVKIAKALGADVVLQHGNGKGDAIYQGLQRLDSEATYVAFTDADFTYPAEYIPKMIEILDRNPNVGMVIGDRFEAEFRLQRSSNPFYFGNRLIATAQHIFNGIKLNDPLSGLRVVRTDIVRNWKPKSRGFDVESELNFFVERKGYSIAEIPIEYRHRLGEKKLKLRHGFGILKRILTEALVDYTRD